MKRFLQISAGVLGFLALAAPVAFASAASVSIESLSPGATVFAKDRLTFRIAPIGFESPTYQLTDSFAGSTASVNNIDPGGNFFWVPAANDAGTHTFTISVHDNSGNTADTTQTITVSPVPSLSIQSAPTATMLMPGTKYTFTVVPSGLTSPTYFASDSFSGSSVGNSNIDASGNFSWTPDVSQNGDHTITIYASDSTGHNASVNQSIRVGVGPTLSLALLSPGATVVVGTTTSFTIIPANFSPTSFGVSDNFPGTTITSNNTSLSGQFSWVPQVGDVGVHVLTISAVVGAFGQSATTSQTITVVGVGGVVPAASLAPTASISNTASGTASSSVLSALQAQLAALMSQVNAQSGEHATPVSGFMFTTYLHPGSQGDEVTHLQTMLSQQGFFSGEASGYYGSQTVDAVAKFQAAHGLTQLGVVGPATRMALNALSSGAQTATTPAAPSSTSDTFVFKNFMGLGEDMIDGSDVMQLQKKLSTLGFFSGNANGTFGPLTQAAVKKFQTAKGISPTGFVGSATVAALNQ